MFAQFFTHIQQAVGLDAFSFTALFYMTIRGIIVYMLGLTLARFNKKFFGVRTPFNLVLFIMLGSIFASAVLSAHAFLATLGTVLALMILNGSITALSFYFPAVELFVKGRPSMLVKNGEIQWDAMKEELITKRELISELNTQLHTNDLSAIETAILASDGTINFIKKQHL